MTPYLPDTNVLIDALSGRRGQRELLADLVRRGHHLGCCDVTIGELFSGVHAVDVPKVEQFVIALHWHGSTAAIARRAGQWRYEYARRGTRLSLADTLIAATAVEYGLTLITNNQKHFPMPELAILSAAQS